MAISITGLVSGGSTALGALNNIGAPTGLTLGSFKFNSFEIPSEITLGGSQQNTTHKLPGGFRVIDVMGSDPHDIEWKGIMLSSNATTRAAALNKLCADGKVVKLTFGKVSKTVLVTDVKLTYRKAHHIEYSIVCRPAPAPVSDSPVKGPGGWLDSIKSAVADVQNTIQGIEDEVTAAIAPITDTIGEISSVLDPILGGLGISFPLLSALENGIAGISSQGLLASAFSTATNMAALDGVLSESQGTIAGMSASSGVTIDAVAANATSGGVVALATATTAAAAIANAPDPSPTSPLVYTLGDLAAASSAIAVQAQAVSTNAYVTLARRDLVANGLVSTSIYPNLETVTNDLYSAVLPPTVTLANGVLVSLPPVLTISVPPIVVYTPPAYVYVPPGNSGGVTNNNPNGTSTGSPATNPGTGVITNPTSPGGSPPDTTAGNHSYTFSDGSPLVFSDGTNAPQSNASSYQFSDGSGMQASDGSNIAPSDQS